MKAPTRPNLAGVVFLVLLAAPLTLISRSTPIAHAGAVCASQRSGAWSAISWDGGAPGANDDVIIAAGDVVTVDAPVSVQQVAIQAGATLQAGALPNVLTANGDVTVDGTLTDRLPLHRERMGLRVFRL